MSQETLRSSPTSYLVALAVAGTVAAASQWWIGRLKLAVALGVGTTIADFAWACRLAVAVGAAAGLAAACGWIYYGGRAETTLRLQSAASRWTTGFWALFALAGIELAAILIAFNDASFATGQLVGLFGMLSANTYLFFWVQTLFSSPPAAKYVPWGFR